LIDIFRNSFSRNNKIAQYWFIFSLEGMKKVITIDSFSIGDCTSKTIPQQLLLLLLLNQFNWESIQVTFTYLVSAVWINIVTQLMPSVGFLLKYWRLRLVCLRNKEIVVLLSTTAYSELEVANLQTAVDTCQCVLVLVFHACNLKEMLTPRIRRRLILVIFNKIVLIWLGLDWIIF
jgi:hypothetical protein